MLSMFAVRQTVAAKEVDDISETVRSGLAALPLADRIRPGASVAIAVGSRGISCYTEVVETLVKALLDLGAEPFLVPAMGSHGGGTAEGQRQVLESYGMGDLGVPIRSSLETVVIGHTSAPGGHPRPMPIHWDRHAAGADAVIAVNRVKAHTSFRGRYESGLFKILALGLGKKTGAELIHAHGVAGAMPAAAQVIVETMPVVAGIAIVENGHHRPARIAVLPGERIADEEPPLLELAKRLQPRIPFDQLDLLIVQEMGKDISGTGMDTNVVGMWRRGVPSGPGPRQPDYRCIAVLDLTDASHGNATGVGMADLIPERLRRKIDWHATYTNCLTSANWSGAKLPITLPTDRDVIEAGLAGLDRETARVVYVRNTLDLETIWVSPALAPTVAEEPGLSIVASAQPLHFTADGSLAPLLPT